MPQEVRAALATEAGKPLAIETVTLADPTADEVLVEMRATGLCHSDLSALDGVHAHPFPAIFGHEGAGVVIACGAAITHVAPGDHVVTFPVPHCGACRHCRSDRTNFCADVPAALAGEVSRFSWRGAKVATFSGLGTFADRLVIKAGQAVPIRRDLPFELACLLACGGATGMGAALYAARVAPGASVAVFGLGGVGLNAVQGARLAGATTIIGVDRNLAREAIGRAFGLTHFIDAGAEPAPHRRIREITGGGADYVLECVGALDLIRVAADSAEPTWGKVVLVGAPPPGNLPLSPGHFFRGRDLTGTLLGGVVGLRQVPQMADWAAEGRIDLAPLITARLPLERINEGMQAMREGRGLRTVVTF